MAETLASLLIDIGNTRLKWAVDSERGFKFGGEDESRPELIDVLFARHWDKLNPGDVFVSCVGNKAVQQRIFDTVRSRWGIQVVTLVSPRQGHGIMNAYERPEKLGSDRWAAMVAAYEQFKGPVCVVSGGTAVTLDVVNSEGRHLGGLILPGYGLMQHCLLAGTRLDFQVDMTTPASAGPGKSTEQCIRQGAIIAITGMIDRMYETLTKEMANMTLILTGGDAKLLHARLNHDSLIAPHLVLQGLAIIHRSGLASA